MNDLGLTLAWSAIQVSLVLIPAAALHAFASRRNPASGAWVASLSLGLVVAFGLLKFAPRRVESATKIVPVAASNPVPTSTRSVASPSEPRSDDGDLAWSLARLQNVWNRFETTAAAPAVRYRRWGSALAAVALTGAGVGLLRLFLGLCAVRLCRRRSRPVDDADLGRLLEELRTSMGCKRRVEVREALDLTTPATAGWRNAVILIPADWPSWDGDERRAVLAHELAHVQRADYATGLVARLALALYFYHPVVHWLVARLQLEQELAADAIGARFAGGKARYLQSLSRLALRQDGRSPCWPARAFLPAKGTLIRRIVMLCEETNTSDRPWSRPRRTLAALLLLAVSAGVSTLQGPARGDDAGAKDGEVKTVKLAPQPDHSQGEAFDLTYFPDDAQGLLAFRPKATFGRAGMGAYRTMLNLLIGQQWSLAANKFGLDPAKPGQGPLRVEMFEEVTTVVTLSRTDGKKPNGRVMIGDVTSVRTTEPVDWVGLLRAFKQEVTEAREGGRVYYKVNIPAFGPDGCFFCPDARTLVFSSEKRLLPLLRRQNPSPAPAFVKGKDGDRLLRGLLVVALDNRDGKLTTILKSDDPKDIDVTTLFAHANSWTFGLDNRDEFVLDAVATCPDAGASEATTRATETLLNEGRKAINDPKPIEPPHREEKEKARRMAETFLKTAKVERDGRSVILRSSGLGTLADIASLIMAEFND